jgi:hypothetical protein
VRFLLHRSRAGRRGPRDLFYRHTCDFEHHNYFALAFGQQAKNGLHVRALSCEAWIEPNRFRKHGHLRFASFHAPRLSVIVDARVPRNGNDPWQDWFTWPVSVTRFVYSHPGFLQQVFRIPAVRELNPEKPQQNGADPLD